MSFIITGLINLVGAIIKYAFLGIGAAAVTAVCTKPSRESFSTFYREWVKDNIKKSATEPKGLDPVILKILAAGGSAAASIGSTTYIENYVFGQLATVRVVGGHSLYFIGGLNGWYYAGSKKG
jgi:hypothetical protein